MFLASLLDTISGIHQSEISTNMLHLGEMRPKDVLYQMELL